MSYRLGVDVGGTFTDLLLINEETGETFRAKVPTTPANQAAAVMDGIERVCVIAGVEPSALTELMHGTTVATNAVLEGKGARVGLITTEGYRQILQVARSYVPGGLAGWIIWPKPEPLAALDDTMEVRERIGARGEIVRELDEASARDALSKLKRRAVEADYRVADQLLREPRARAAHPRDRRRGSAGTPALAFERNSARDARVRAHHYHCRQLLRAADGGALSVESQERAQIAWSRRARSSCCAPTAD